MKTREGLFIIEAENKTVFFGEKEKGALSFGLLSFGANVESEKCLWKI
jgi:hypothetical protein